LPPSCATQFERRFAHRVVGLVWMEACGAAHHAARWLNGLGMEVRLLPAAPRLPLASLADAV
jgi:transposase